jgi:hypothetical protein
MSKVQIGFYAVLLAAGCGPVGNGFHGTIGGQSFAVAESFAYTEGSATDGHLEVLLVSQPGLCAELASGKYPKDAQVLRLWMGDTNADHDGVSQPTGSGTYTIEGELPSGAYKGAGVTYFETGSACQPTIATGNSGSIHLIQVGSKRAAGTFDLMFGPDHVTGSFDTTDCAGLEKLPVQCG